MSVVSPVFTADTVVLFFTAVLCVPDVLFVFVTEVVFVLLFWLVLFVSPVLFVSDVSSFPSDLFPVLPFESSFFESSFFAGAIVTLSCCTSVSPCPSALTTL